MKIPVIARGRQHRCRQGASLTLFAPDVSWSSCAELAPTTPPSGRSAVLSPCADVGSRSAVGWPPALLSRASVVPVVPEIRIVLVARSSAAVTPPDGFFRDPPGADAWPA